MRAILLALSQFALVTSVARAEVLRTRIELDSGIKWVDHMAIGICPDILASLAQHLGDVEIDWGEPGGALPQKRLLTDVQLGRLDLACAFGKTAGREQSFIIPAEPLYTNRVVAAVRSADKLDIRRFEDLAQLHANETILLNWGARLVERLEKLGIRNVDQGAERAPENLRKLVLGRGRVFLFHEPGMSWEVSSAGLTGQVKILPTALSTDAHYLLLSHHVSPLLVARVTQALRHMRSDGSLPRIEAKWSNFRIEANVDTKSN